MMFNNVSPQRSTPRLVIRNNANVLGVEHISNIVGNLVNDTHSLVRLKVFTLRFGNSGQAVNIGKYANVVIYQMEGELTSQNNILKLNLSMVANDVIFTIVNFVGHTSVDCATSFSTSYPSNKCVLRSTFITNGTNHIDNTFVIWCNFSVMNDSLYFLTDVFTPTLYQVNIVSFFSLVVSVASQSVEVVWFECFANVSGSWFINLRLLFTVNNLYGDSACDCFKITLSGASKWTSGIRSQYDNCARWNNFRTIVSPVFRFTVYLQSVTSGKRCGIYSFCTKRTNSRGAASNFYTSSGASTIQRNGHNRVGCRLSTIIAVVYQHLGCVTKQLSKSNHGALRRIRQKLFRIIDKLSECQSNDCASGFR